MNETIDKAIEKMAELCAANPQPEAAMKFSQAALNLAHTKETLLVEAKDVGKKRVGS